MPRQTLPEKNATLPKNLLRVWDLPIRLFHGALLVCFVGAVISVNLEAMKVHRVFGMTIFGLVVFRLLWGLCGSETALFKTFFPRPKAVVQGLRSFFKKTPPQHIGHDALGGLATLTIITSLLATAMLGMFSNDDLFFEGSLAFLISKSHSDTISYIHSVMAKVSIGLIYIHILVVLFHLFYKKNNLISPMITGRKALENPSLSEPRFVSVKRALLITMIPLVLIALILF